MVEVNLMSYQTNNTYTIPKGTNVPSPYLFTVKHKDAPEWYRNGHFNFSVVGKSTVHNIIDWSNHSDARKCTNTRGYVVLNVSNPSDQDCTITIDSIVVSKEF